MTKNWKDIHPNFTLSLQEQWEIDNDFTYEQTKEWIDIGLLPTDADFCAWLQAEGYTALAVLNSEDQVQLREKYQRSFILKKSLFDWYTDSKLTFSQFSLLAHKLDDKGSGVYSLKEIKELLANTPVPQSNYPLTKIMLVLALTGTVIYLLQ